MAGPSPRVRGTRGLRRQHQGRKRSIPACAGNTNECELCDRLSVGPSPRVRGTHDPDRRHEPALRSIPACAGNTSRSSTGGPRQSVHPRVCGEHMQERYPHDAVTGPSPRVRGTHRPRQTHLRGDRSIPACAGNTRASTTATRSPTVHPRVCGEHTAPCRMSGGIVGPSPRVRGTLDRAALDTGVVRSIPACAGNTRLSPGSGHAPSVHPRVCGEHTASRALSFACSGPSPRVRGTPDDAVDNRVPRRSIPACAGNTPRRCPPRAPRSVHPRVCGEHHDRPRSWPGSSGPSPRVRGTRWCPRRPRPQPRSIPACAGNTA